MLEELKQRGNNIAFKRSIYGVIGTGGLCAIIFLNLFGLDEAVIERWKWIVLTLFVFTAIGFIINWVRAVNASPTKGIEKFCNQSSDPSAMMERLNKVWSDGVDLKECRIDNDYIIFLTGMSTKVIPLENAVWVYKIVHINKGVRHVRLDVNYKDGSSKGCSIGEAAIDSVLDYVLQNSSDIAVGSDNELEKLFRKKDMDGIRERALLQRTGLEVK